jgi:hypothetical protein
METPTCQAPLGRVSKRLRARVCAASILLCLAPAAAAQGLTSTAGVLPEAAAAAPYASTNATAPVAAADVEARARALEPLIPPEPNPVPFQIPEAANPDEFGGLQRFALALMFFSALLVVGTLAALFLSLVRREPHSDVASQRAHSQR